MTMLPQEPEEIIACTISRDMQDFDLLIDSMETILRDLWGDMDFQDATLFLQSPQASELQFVTVAINAGDEADLDMVSNIITNAKTAGLKVIIVAHNNINPKALGKLLGDGGDEFVAYPLRQNEFENAVKRVMVH